MRPHEEIWAWDAARGLIMCGERRVSLMAFAGDGRLASEAPAMARALLDVINSTGYVTVDGHDAALHLRIRKILTDAGVLP